jgi:tetratricopeptide (TPR) repeat protein
MTSDIDEEYLKKPYYWYEKARYRRREGKITEAIDCYNKALELDPYCDLAWYNKAWILSRLDKFDEAIKCYDRSLKIDPTCCYAWYNKAWIYIKLKQIKEAIKCYDKVISRNPDCSNTYDENYPIPIYNAVEREIKSYALERLNPNYTYTWYVKALIFDGLGQLNEALKYYDKILQTDPDYYKYLLANKGYVLYRLEKYCEAMKCIDKVLFSINPNDCTCLHIKFLITNKLGKNDELMQSAKGLIDCDYGLKIKEYYSEYGIVCMKNRQQFLPFLSAVS